MLKIRRFNSRLIFNIIIFSYFLFQEFGTGAEDDPVILEEEKNSPTRG